MEAAANGDGGIIIDVDRVPPRATDLTPYEIMLSESQERMLAIVERGHEDEIIEVFRRWGLHSETIGEVSSAGTLEVRSGGDVAAELSIELLVDAPTYEFPVVRPAYLDEVQRLDHAAIPRPDDLDAAFLALLASPNIASRAPIFGRYDHMVGTNTVVQPGGDAAVLRIKGTERGIALTTDGNGRLCYLDPREGGRIAVAEAARNVSCVGATPIALTDCLNMGSPEEPDAYFQLAQVIDGMAEACRAFGVPVVSGNVSLYNESDGQAIWPTPVVGMLGLLDRLDRRCDIGFNEAGDVIALLGETHADLGGSEYLKVIHGRTAGRPRIDLDGELRLQTLVRDAIQDGQLASAHDCSDGGLAVTLAESAFRSGIGIDCADAIADGLRDDMALFAETQSRIVVSIAPDDWNEFEERARTAGVPCARLGLVGGERLRIGSIDVGLDQARDAWAHGLGDALSTAA